MLDNWFREFQTWGTFRVCLYAGRNKVTALADVDAGLQEIMLIGLEAYR